MYHRGNRPCDGSHFHARSAFERFKTTARCLILSIIFRFYHCKRNVSSPWFDPRTKQRVIYRHPKNLREHQEILEDYTDIMLKDGLVQGVAGQPWATQRLDSSTGTVITFLLSFGTRCDAFYLAKERAPNNPPIMHTEANGLTDIVVFGSGELQLPPDLETFLTEKHNQWHGGAGANFITVLVWVNEAEDEWKEFAEQKGWTKRGLPTSGEDTFEKLAWEHISGLDKWKERFPQATPDFYKKSRLAHNIMVDHPMDNMFNHVKKWCGLNVNFADPKFKPMNYYKFVRNLGLLISKTVMPKLKLQFMGKIFSRR